MISDKNVRRVLIITICIVLGVSLASCADHSDNSALDQLENLQNMQSTEEEDTDVPSDDVRKYRVVISACASDGILAKALELSSAITDKTEKACTVVRDTDAVSTGGDTMEIQLGYVERKEAKEVLCSLNRDDYLCTRFSDAVVLGGKVENATASAVDKFVAEILPRSEGKTLMNDGDGFNVSVSYDLNAIMLCDIGLGNYDIVCDAQTSTIADDFRELFASKCGAYADVSTEPRSGVREIIFRISDSAQTGFCGVYLQDEDVLIESDRVYGLSVAVCKLYEVMSESVKDGVGYIDISSPLFYSYEATDFSVMAVAIDSSDAPSFGNALSQLSISTTDVITLGIVTREAWAVSQSYIPANYLSKLCSLGNDKYFSVIYNAEKIENIYLDADENEDTVCVSIGKSEEEVFLISVYEKVYDNRQANIDALINKVSKSPMGAVATFIGIAGYSSEFGVAQAGASVEYISCVGTGGSTRNVVAMVTDKVVECDKISCETIDSVGVLCISVVARNVYCPEYLDIIS